MRLGKGQQTRKRWGVETRLFCSQNCSVLFQLFHLRTFPGFFKPINFHGTVYWYNTSLEVWCGVLNNKRYLDKDMYVVTQRQQYHSHTSGKYPSVYS